MNTRVTLALLLLIAMPGCGAKEECKPESLSVQGEFHPATASFEFEAATASITHRLDVDDWEDGLVTEVKLELSRGTGCTLKLEAGGCLDSDDRLAILSASFAIDSQCPGFPEESEGLYLLLGDSPIGSIQLGTPKVPGGQLNKACFNSTMSVHLEGALTSAATSELMSVASSTILVQGDFVSHGAPDASARCETRFLGDVSDDVGGSPTDVSAAEPEELDAGPRVALTVSITCPECKDVAHVRFYGSKGWTIGTPEYVHVFHNPAFPIQETIETATNPEGSTLNWPEGNVTFQAFQDTEEGGMLPEEGEPVSQLVTTDLVAGHLNKVALELVPGADTTISCTPGEDICLSAEMTGHCNETGDGYDKQECVPGDESCSELTGKCEERVCVPSSVTCATANSHHKCLPSGTGWVDEVECQEGYVCLNGACMNEQCLGEVMFLVDSSASMFLQWDAVSSSIQAIANLSPMASFGICHFPEFLTICEVPSSPKIAMAAGQAGELAKWFDKHEPFGQTPLVNAMKTMKTVLPPLFTGTGGALVLLSDGEDTCTYPEMPYEERKALLVEELIEATSALYEEHNIKTFVVGYQYKGSPDQLVAIAQNGGTGKSTYTEAGNEQELTNVLVGIVEDLKLCFE